MILIHAQTTLTCVSLPWLRYHHRAQCCAFWLCVLRLLGSLCSSETCLRHRRDNRLLFLMPQVRKHQVNGFFCNFSTVDMYNKCLVSKVKLCCLRIDLVTCFSLFDNLDLFSSGCFSRNGAGLLKGEASIIFKIGQCKTQTADCGPGVKCRLWVKCRLQTKSKTQAGVKCRPSINCSCGRV